MEMFDELIRTTVKPDGEVEVELVQPDPKEMENAVADMVRSWRDFKDANADYPIAVWGY